MCSTYNVELDTGIGKKEFIEKIYGFFLSLYISIALFFSSLQGPCAHHLRPLVGYNT
jgi:hypothetical protein